MSIDRPSVSKIISENANRSNQSGSGEIADLDNIDFLVMGLSSSAACYYLRTRAPFPISLLWLVPAEWRTMNSIHDWEPCKFPIIAFFPIDFVWAVTKRWSTSHTWSRYNLLTLLCPDSLRWTHQIPIQNPLPYCIQNSICPESLATWSTGLIYWNA